jgi:cytochrome c-type biogenesis protein CcmI
VTTWIAAIMLIIAVALFVSAPLTDESLRRRRDSSNELELERLEHERGLAVQGLRELEFDHEMGKIDEADYRSLRAKLEERALATMTALESVRKTGRAATLRVASRRAKPSPISAQTSAIRQVNFCPQCGVRAAPRHNFCSDCGNSLRIGTNAAMRAE